MRQNSYKILIVFTLLTVGLYFLVMSLMGASGFLKPFVLALLIAMVLIPLSRKLEAWGLNRLLSSMSAVLVSLLVIPLVLGLLAVQINKVVEDWPEIKKNLKPQVERVSDFVERSTGLSDKELLSFLDSMSPVSAKGFRAVDGEKNKEVDKKENSSPKVSSQAFGTAGSALLNMFSFMGSFLLVFIYVFFALFYRRKIKLSILRFFDEEKRAEAEKVLSQSVSLSVQYLNGRLILVFFLAIIYAVGLSVFGIRNAILIGIFSAILTFIPYIGNIIGFILAMIMATASGGELWMYLGVMITFSISQFAESYILQPFVVGDKVDLNPLITIIVVVVGGAVWGIMGMIISIPIFGILKIVFDHIPATEPMGYALGNEDVGSDDPGVFEKLVNKIKRK